MTNDALSDSADPLKHLAEQVNILQGIHAATIRWSDVSAAAQEAESHHDFLKEVMRLLDVNENQARAVAEMQVQRVTKDARAQLKAHLQELKAELAQARREQGPATDRPQLS